MRHSKGENTIPPRYKGYFLSMTAIHFGLTPEDLLPQRQVSDRKKTTRKRREKKRRGCWYEIYRKVKKQRKRIKEKENE